MALLQMTWLVIVCAVSAENEHQIQTTDPSPQWSASRWAHFQLMLQSPAFACAAAVVTGVVEFALLPPSSPKPPLSPT